MSLNKTHIIPFPEWGGESLIKDNENLTYQQVDEKTTKNISLFSI
jgi:hypothetical protein